MFKYFLIGEPCSILKVVTPLWHQLKDLAYIMVCLSLMRVSIGVWLAHYNIVPSHDLI